jgi:hypothetical protein
MEVVIATGQHTQQNTQQVLTNHINANMIITGWELEQDRFFSLSFTNTGSGLATSASTSHSRAVKRMSSHRGQGSTGSVPRSSTSSDSGQSSRGARSATSTAITSPSALLTGKPPLPPLGPPLPLTAASAPSHLQKLMMMKDALLDNTDVPILAMWHDVSLTLPNRGNFVFVS